MAKKKSKKSTRSPSTKAENDRIQCHFISNTHWDREWRHSAQRVRHKLVYTMDLLFDIFEKQPKFKHFHLDSQTLPIQDYLETRPEMEQTVRKYVRAGKLAIGPWFCLPDEFCVGGESLIRNLLLGHKIAGRFGKISKTGYSPFSWGQISQMPQIYKGFGIDVASFYRGINTEVAPRSEYIWEGADGTRIVTSRLAYRPRYNVWFIIQRPVYWNEQDENNRFRLWGTPRAPFRFISRDYSGLECRFVHPEFAYHEQNVKERAEQAIAEQDDAWSQPHRFWSCSFDASYPDIREVQLIEDCNKALGSSADVFHSSVAAWQDGVLANVSPDWPVVRGEIRYSSTKGSSAPLIGWILSARTFIKQDNFRTERALTYYAEPIAAFAGMLGAAYPQNFIDLAYNWLLQNHGHDSIGGCGQDIIHEDMLFRSRQSREISSCVNERAFMDIAGSINLSQWPSESMALVVYNPAPFERSEVMEVIIDIPSEWDCESFEIVDENDKNITCQLGQIKSPHNTLVENPADVETVIPSSRFEVQVDFRNVPSMGYRTFRVLPIKKAGLCQPGSMLTGPQTMENEFLSVKVNSNGTFDIRDKKTNRVYKGLGYFRDSSEIGNPWEAKSVQNENVFTTLNEKASVALTCNGELATTFRMTIDWALPEGVTADELSRSDHIKPFRIINTVTLRRGQPWVEIVTELDNTVKNHYLQLSFPTQIKTSKVCAQGQFDVIERPIAKPDYSRYEETPQTEQPMNSFIDVSDPKAGLAIINEGLKGYEAHDDRDNTVSLTLLRCCRLRIDLAPDCPVDFIQPVESLQCPGKHTFRYAVMPHAGNWAQGQVWQMAERFNLALQACQIGPTGHGTESMSKSFLEIKPQGLHVSAVKQSESGKGWIVRLFNPLNRTVKGKICLNGGRSRPQSSQSPVERVQAEFALPKGKGRRWKTVRQVTLEELPQKKLKLNPDGWVEFQISKKKIMTMEFLP